MRYITIFVLAIVLAAGCQKTQVAERTKLTDAETHEVFKSERLGEELYLQDVTAARASRMLIQTVGPIPPGVLSGWIVVKDGAKTLTRFIKKTGEDINVMYDVRIDFKGDGIVTKDNLKPLSKTELAMFRARQNAMHVAPGDCTRAYNTAVIEDIESNGWLVYLLAATNKNTIMVGGHTRVSVSPDGNNVTAVTRLYDSCLAIPLPADTNNTGRYALNLGYQAADVPSEIHVYLNRIYGYVINVNTARGLWQVRNGNIYLVRPAENTGQTGKAENKK